jgi:cytochrome c peroxidase
MLRSIAPSSTGVASHLCLSSADFITIIAECNFRYRQPGGARPHALRCGFRHSRSLFTRFPANQRSDLGEVSQGQLVTVENYYQLFNGIINPKQHEGLRLLVTPFPQQQFNQTEDRRSEQPSRGVTCFDCHSNGHTNRATHLAPDARPTETRHRITTPTLRGVFIQRLFGSQRVLKTVEDFTEFEQRGAYFDCNGATARRRLRVLRVTCNAGDVRCRPFHQAVLDAPVLQSVTDEMRAVVETLWPDLLHKLTT